MAYLVFKKNYGLFFLDSKLVFGVFVVVSVVLLLENFGFIALNLWPMLKLLDRKLVWFYGWIEIYHLLFVES